ncbi:MAG: hypothetical protein ACKN89_00325 [Cyanobium sp.]
MTPAAQELWGTTLHHGTVVTVASPGVDSGKPRPAVVVQADLWLQAHPSVTLGPLISNVHIDVSVIYGPLMIWAMQQWQKPDKILHLALDITMLWNSHCVVMLFCVCHGRAIPVLWTRLEHSSASVSAEVVISLLQKADQLLQGFETVVVLADRAFPSNDLLSWLDDNPGWKFLMRLRGRTVAWGVDGLGLSLPIPDALQPFLKRTVARGAKGF